MKKKLNTWLLVVSLLGCAALGGATLRAPIAKADAQTLEASLLTSILQQLIQINQGIKDRPTCGCSTGQGAGQPDVWQ